MDGDAVGAGHPGGADDGAGGHWDRGMMTLIHEQKQHSTHRLCISNPMHVC